MNATLLAATLLQVVVPPVLIVLIAWGVSRSGPELLLEAAATALFIAATALAGVWLALPSWLPLLWLCLLAAALLRVLARRTRRRPHAVAVLARAVVVAGAALVVVQAARGRIAPPHAIDLQFPLGPGDYAVANGGGVELLNAHLVTLDAPRYAAWRGQSHGVDIVGRGGWGSRRRGLAPPDPAAYAIFGAPVLAPCAGMVVDAEDGHPDMRVPRRDRTQLEGNHVVLECDGLWVVLAHLRRGSVRVHAGQPVSVGEHVGDVGNSGNSDEPHLHVHVQQPGTTLAPAGGAPVPARFGGRWLTRNAQVSVQAPRT